MSGRMTKGAVRRVLTILALVAVMAGADVAFDDLFAEEADAARPVLGIIELNATSPYQEGNMAWVQSGPSFVDGKGETQVPGIALVEGRVTIYKVARIARQKVYVNLKARTDDPDLLVSVSPQII